MAFGKLGQRFDPGGVFVQCRDVVVALASGRKKIIAAFKGDFFEGFQAVGGKAWADHINPRDAGVRPFFQGGSGIGLQPLRLAEA